MTKAPRHKKGWIIYRKASPYFFSIEKVFDTLLPHLDLNKKELPFESKGLINRIKNILSLVKEKQRLLHVTGHDHYLLWFPFKKAILTIHDVESLKRKTGWRKWLFKKLWFDIPIRNARAVTTISQFSKRELLELNYHHTPITVIPNPLSSRLGFSPKPKISEKPKILHLGTKKNKNLERLIESLNGIACELNIVGMRNEEIDERIQAHSIDCRFHSQLTDQELNELYTQSDIVAFVSTYEGFGLPIIEAQAMGRVVLTSNLASMPEVAGDGAYFVDPFSVKDIRKGILELISNAELRTELIDKGRENVNRFDPEKIAAQYQELYNKLSNET